LILQHQDQQVRDDGNGIDVEKVKQKAVEKGNLTQEQADALTEKEAIDLLFKPFSLNLDISTKSFNL